MTSSIPTSDLRAPTSESASTNEVLVRVNGVSKKFCRDLKKSLWYGVKDVAAELFPFGKQKSEIKDRRSDSSSLSSDLGPPTSDPGLRPGEFWANKDIFFELRRGECIGLIGRNGAGKTTLLKMLNGLIKPDEGTIEMRGRVGALIALGAGFNPILTGRENIYVNGSILGLAKQEIDAKIEDIIDFAEIREFINSPVQSYSSGMQVRLGFAVATAMDPDILILDEVLAVGDAAFRAKCYKRISKIREKAAIIFVSHSMDQVAQICDRILHLENGNSEYFLNIEDGINCYNLKNTDNTKNINKFEAISTGFEIKLLRDLELTYQESLNVDLLINSPRFIEKADLRIVLKDGGGLIALDSYTKTQNINFSISKGLSKIKTKIKSISVRNGSYYLCIALLNRENNEHIYWAESIKQVVATSGPATSASCYAPQIIIN